MTARQQPGFKASIDLGKRFVSSVTKVEDADRVVIVPENREVTDELIFKQMEAIAEETPELFEALGGQRWNHDLRDIREAPTLDRSIAASYFSPNGRELACRTPSQRFLADLGDARRVVREELQPEQKRALIARLESEITDGQMLPAPILMGEVVRWQRLPVVERDGIPVAAMVADRGVDGAGFRFTLLSKPLDAWNLGRGGARLDDSEREGCDSIFAVTDDEFQVSVVGTERVPVADAERYAFESNRDRRGPLRQIPLQRDALVDQIADADPRAAGMLVAAASEGWDLSQTKDFLRELAELNIEHRPSLEFDNRAPERGLDRGGLGFGF